jgi:hypothetical protein
MTHLPEEEKSALEKIQKEARTLVEEAKHKADNIKERPEIQAFLEKMNQMSVSVHEAANSEQAQKVYDQLNHLKSNVDNAFESAKASDAGQWVIHQSTDAATAVSSKVHELVSSADGAGAQSMMETLKGKAIAIKDDLIHKADGVKDVPQVKAVLNKVREYSATIAGSVNENVVMKTYSMLVSLKEQVDGVMQSVKQSERGQW